MTDFSFLESPLLFASAIILFLALIFSIKKIVKNRPQASRFHKISLMILQLIIFVSFLGLIIQPQYSSNTSNTVRLITNFGENRPPKLNDNDYLLIRSKQQMADLGEIYRLRNSARIIVDPSQLIIREPALANLEILGDGLSESELTNFQSVNIIYKAPIFMTGIINPQWPSSVHIGDDFKLVAGFNSPHQAIYRVELINPANQVVDKKSITNGEYFSLTARPKTLGAHQYRLRSFSRQEELIQEEIIPISVTQTPPARIVIVQSSPSFETKQLQNWATENGAIVVTRTKISRDIYTTRTINDSPENTKKNNNVNRNPLTENNLKRFDLLVMDGRELLELNVSQLNSIDRALRAGLGMLVLADQDLVNADKKLLPRFLSSFQLSAIKNETQVEVELLSQNLQSHSLSDSIINLSASPLNQNQPNDLSHSVLVATNNRLALVSNSDFGTGKIAVSVLKETFRLATSEQRENYTRLWKHLISNIAREIVRNRIILNNNHSLVFKNHLAHVCLLSSNQIGDFYLHSDANQSDQQSRSIQLQPDPFLPNQFCGFFWPRQTGWQTLSPLKVDASDTAIFFVHPTDAWLAHQQHEKIRATIKKTNGTHETKSKHSSMKKVSNWYFWVVLLVCMSLIWIERKYWAK